MYALFGVLFLVTMPILLVVIYLMLTGGLYRRCYNESDPGGRAGGHREGRDSVMTGALRRGGFGFIPGRGGRG